MSVPRSECEPVLPLLAALRDGELDPATAASVFAHVETCDDCGERLEAQERVSKLVSAHARTPEVDPRQRATFEEALERELRHARPEVARPRFALLRRLEPGPIAAAAAGLLLTAGLALGLAGVPGQSALAFSRRRLPDLPHHDPVVHPVPEHARATTTELDKAHPELDALTPAQRAALARDGLVQVPALDARPTDFLAALGHGPGPIRPLVTIDAALLVWNATVARAAVEVERARVEPLLRESLDAIGRELETLSGEARDGGVRAACERARGIVGVAADLDGLRPQVTGELREDVLADAAAVWLGRGRAVSRTRLERDANGNPRGVALDLDAFRPRGPLAASPEHFRTIAWLSRASLALEGPDADPRAAALVVLALARARSQGVRVLAVWDELDATVELLHGPQHDLGAFELLAALGRAFGTAAAADDLAPDAGVARFVAEARREAGSRAWALGSGQQSGARFTLLGGTRTLEGTVLEAVSAPRLPGRSRPGSLDLLAALGSRPARTLASLEGAPGYDRALDSLAPRFESVRDVPRALSFAGSGIERARLFALAGLLEGGLVEGGEAGPSSEAQESRVLLAALAALNGTDPSPLDAPEPVLDPLAPLPLVEPAPALYERLAHGARRIAQGLEPGTVAGSPVAKSFAQLRRVAALLSGLARASVETLEDRAPSPRGAAALAAFYPTLAVLAPEHATSVEDLHVVVLPSGEREVLERASGPFDRILEIARIPGADRRSEGASAATDSLVIGPALSARELVVRDARLVPESLERAPRPLDPSWATHVVK